MKRPRFYPWAKEEVRETILFMGKANTIKYIGITLTKNVNDLYENNFKSF